MKETIGKILDLLTPRERKSGAIVLAMVLIMALIETAGVASVMPFLAVLANPEVVETNRYLAQLYDALGFQSTQAFLMALGIGSFLIVVFGAFFRLGTQYALQRWAHMRRHSVSQRLLAGYLRQPYEFFLNRNTADLSKSILSEVEELTQKVFQPGIQLIAYGITALILIGLLVVMDPWIALVVTGIVGGSYILIYVAVRGLLGRIGRDRASANRERFIAANEVLGGIKDIKVLGGEEVYLDRFRGPSVRFSKHQASSAVIGLVPKHLIEAIGFGGVLALAIYLMTTRADLSGVLPILGLYAFAGYRLLPAAQQIFAAVSKLRFGWGAIEVVHGDLVVTARARPSTERAGAGPPASIRETLRFEDVSYTYPGAEAPTLKHLQVDIPRNRSLGIVGSTGAGKTTFVDLLLGLLTPSSGNVLVDGRPISTVGIRRWQRAIGYVPQHIFLTDASIAENIALGIAAGDIDHDRISTVARVAQIDAFVQELPRGYATLVGERGVRLSGGQRQRIGIARALYHNPELLVLDEATSALDGVTEAAVMEAIAALQGGKTIIIVAHRLSTVRSCDLILMIEDGREVTSGSYDQLMEESHAFQKLVSAT